MKPEGEYQKVIVFMLFDIPCSKANMVTESGPFEDVSPIENGDFNCRVSSPEAILFRFCPSVAQNRVICRWLVALHLITLAAIYRCFV